MSGKALEMSPLELHLDAVPDGALQKEILVGEMLARHLFAAASKLPKEATNMESITPIVSTAVCDGQEDLLDDLLHRCTDGQINALDREGFAALHYAVKYRMINIIKKLLAAQCDPDVCNKDGINPLQIAACCLPQASGTVMESDGASDERSTGHQVIQMLLEADGRSVRERLVDGESNIGTPLHTASSRGNLPAVQELLRHIQKLGANVVNLIDGNGNTPLHEACIHGNLSIVKELLKHGADANAQNGNLDDGKSPLQTACTGGYVAVVKAILDYSHERAKELVETHVRGSTKSLMHFAVESGYVEMVNVLLGYGANPSVQNDAKVAPIHIAAGQGCSDIARALLDCDDSCKDLLDKQHRSPLHYAARYNQVEMIKLLLSKGCEKEFLDKDSATPLLLSVKSGKANAVQALISGGCDVNTKDRDGKSTVFWAVQEGHLDVLKVLLKDKRGIMLVHVPEPRHLDTPFHIAAKMGSAEAIELLATHLGEQLDQQLHQLSEDAQKESEAFYEINPKVRSRLQTIEQERVEMEVLRVKVQHLDFRNDEHKTPLHLAAMSGIMDVVKFLICKHPPSLTHVDNDRNTPLHLAVHHGKLEVAGFLIQEGAKVDARDWCGNTPLHLAAKGGHAEIASLLVKADASLEAMEMNEETPLLQAAMNGHVGIISLLTDAGAQLEAKDNEERTALFVACSNGLLAAAKVLMEKGADVTAQNVNKLSCLDAAVIRGHKSIALAIIQSGRWKEALCHTDGEMTPFKRMIQQMPSAAEAALDRCLKTSNEHDLNKAMVWVYFDYKILDDLSVKPSEESLIRWRPRFSAKDHPLALMVKYRRDNLLRHPVVTSLMEEKWRTYGVYLFLINLLTYLIFLLFLTLYALLLPHPDHRFCHKFSVTRSVASMPENGTVCPFEATSNHSEADFNMDPTVPTNNRANVALYIAAVMVIITAVARLLLVECYQFLRTRYLYFLSFENYIEILAYVSSIIFVSQFGDNCWCPTKWQWQLGALTVFLTWINLILFLKRVPLLGIYVLMFKTILFTFMKFALIAFLFVVAFSIAFYMLLYKALDEVTLDVNVSPFRTTGLSLIKTMVMTIGEFDYDNIFGHSNDSSQLLTSFPQMAYILWIIFLIVMPILMTNLLVGLAVGDIKAIQDEAELRSNLLQIEADNLLPHVIRRMFKMDGRLIYFRQQNWHYRTRLVHFQQKLRLLWRIILKRVWGGERWDSCDNMRKCKSRGFEQQIVNIQSPIEQVQTQTEQLSREVKNLIEQHSHMVEKNSHMMEKFSYMMERINHSEQLLLAMTEKLGIHLEPKRYPHH